MEIGGRTAAGFEEVAAEFERNFAERGDVSAAFAAVRGDEVLVDLWGGAAREDTLFVIFSGTKGVVAVCMLLLRERGLLDFDAPVSRYWPEFGKPEIRVRDVLAHTARLPGIDRELTLEEFADREAMAAELEGQAPSEDPRAGLVYHAFTYGWLCGELVRRTDGRTVSRFIADELAAPLGLELWLGLPEALEPRVATLELADSWPTSPNNDPDVLARDPLLRSIWGNPMTFGRSSFPWNSRAYHAAEIPGAGAIASARSVARLYASLPKLLSRESLALANATFSEGVDRTSGSTSHFGPGFQLQTERMSLGPVPDAFGHGGAGGSKHGRWPAEGVGFSYAMSVMRDDEDVDPRPAALLAALHRALSR
jgi:CubicO group peptidase (beta-lactamase class C family)